MEDQLLLYRCECRREETTSTAAAAAEKRNAKLLHDLTEGIGVYFIHMNLNNCQHRTMV